MCLYMFLYDCSSICLFSKVYPSENLLVRSDGYNIFFKVSSKFEFKKSGSKKIEKNSNFSIIFRRENAVLL